MNKIPAGSFQKWIYLSFLPLILILIAACHRSMNTATPPAGQTSLVLSTTATPASLATEQETAKPTTVPDTTPPPVTTAKPATQPQATTVKPTTTQPKATTTQWTTPPNLLSAQIAALTNEDGSGTITYDMPLSAVKAALQAAGITYAEQALSLRFADGSAYAFAKADSEATLDHFLLVQSPKGVRMGDSADTVQKIYGKTSLQDFNGNKFLVYHFGKLELIFILKNSAVSQIMLNFATFERKPSAAGISAPASAVPVAVSVAGKGNAQKNIQFASGVTAKEKFVQIAESQQGYASGQVGIDGVVSRSPQWMVGQNTATIMLALARWHGARALFLGAPIKRKSPKQRWYAVPMPT
ncbi:MAG: hypothetical protein LBJ12_01940 [Oscillospiraceae bacterium]|nr:hypothetical protein [Oscillospiraceae bacterium]